MRATKSNRVRSASALMSTVATGETSHGSELSIVHRDYVVCSGEASQMISGATVRTERAPVSVVAGLSRRPTAEGSSEAGQPADVEANDEYQGPESTTYSIDCDSLSQ
jgi:hypothetical protein